MLFDEMQASGETTFPYGAMGLTDIESSLRP